MKRSSIFLLPMVGLLATALFLHSCQKEISTEELKKAHGLGAVTERAPNGVIYGVTLYDGVNPCRIIGIDENTGLVVSNVPAFYIDPNGIQIDLVDLKGICVTDAGGYFLTTGPSATTAPSPYNDALFKVNPPSGQCGYLSTSPYGAVSDLEFLGTRFIGLADNSNNVIMIFDNNNNFGTYTMPLPINGITAGFTLKGLSLVNDPNGFYFVGCATSANPADMPELYRLNLGGGVSNIVGFLSPANELGAGHCAIGYDNDIQQILVNRNNSTAVNGLNSFGWLSTSIVIPTNFFGAQDFNFEDLTSWAY